MATYTTIDLSSGYVWWSGDAADPAAACTASTLETGGETVRYCEDYSRAAIDQGGYAVYEYTLPVGADGQDCAVIAAVVAAPLAGYYVRRPE